MTSIPKKIDFSRYSYDPSGNRRLDHSLDAQGEARTTKPSTAQLQQNPAVYNPAISEATNQLDDSGYEYDEAGNLLCDPTHQRGPGATPASYYAYDAENHIISAGGSAQSGGAEYFYDGDGRRVQKAWGGQVTVFVYDAGGRLIAEYSNGFAQISG